MPDLHETYSYNDKNPFGAQIAYSMLKNSYPRRDVELIREDFSDEYKWDYDTASLYMNISTSFYLSNRDAESLLDFVYKGNTVFIAAENIDTILLSKMHVAEKADRNLLSNSMSLYRNTSTGFTEELAKYPAMFSYYYFPFRNYFSKTESMHAHSIGVNESGRPNLSAFFWGKGRIFLQCEPRALSNYFLLTDSNYRYMQEIMQLLPAGPENIYWDDQHNSENYRSGDGNSSALDTIMRYPALSRAFFISLALLLLYIFFNSKRRQRIIPVIKPVENTSVAFTEAIAGLYIGKKDNKLISEKMITYFNEHVRSKYFMHMNINDEGYSDMLSRKSGVPADVTAALTKAMKGASDSPKVNDQQLLLLNSLIEKFFKNKI